VAWRTRYRLRQATERQHILIGYLKALDALDEVIALIRASSTVDEAREGLMTLLEVDEIQARAILTMQLRQLAALERQKLRDEYDELTALIADYNAILADPARQRRIVSTELAEIVDRYGDDRRTRIIPGDGEVSMTDLIPDEEVVVTITRGGYAKRTRTDAYRAQRRGGRGVRGAALRADDLVEHFFTTSNHHWLLFFTNLGRVYRAKAYELPEGARDARGQHVANLLAFGPDERIAQVLDIDDYAQAPYLVLATRSGLVKKTRLSDYDSPRSGGLIAVKLREDDELVSARLVSEGDDLLLVSRRGQSIRFPADDQTMRPMGRDTSGVTGMRFRVGDELLSADVVPAQDADGGLDVLIVTDGGYTKRTPVGGYRRQGRGGTGIKVARLNDERGVLVSALVATEADEVLVIMTSGRVMRSRVADIRSSGRDTMGVILTKPGDNDAVLGATINREAVAYAEADAVTDIESISGELEGVTSAQERDDTPLTALQEDEPDPDEGGSA